MIGKKIEPFKPLHDKNIDNYTDVITLLGQRGSGKTSVICNYLKYHDKDSTETKQRAKNILYYSPTWRHDATLQAAIQKIKTNVILTDKISDLLSFIKIISSDADEKQKRNGKKDFNIIAIDDSSGDNELIPPGQNKTPLVRAILASRHINTSFIVALHRWNTFPTTARNVVNFVYLFKQNEDSLINFAKESEFNRKAFLEIYNRYMKRDEGNRHDFLLLDFTNLDIYFNGTELVYSEGSGPCPST